MSYIPKMKDATPRVINIDITKLENENCLDCNNGLFAQRFITKKIPMLQSNTGRDELLNIPVMICVKCGQVQGVKSPAA